MSEDDGYFAARWDSADSASTGPPTFSVTKFGGMVPISVGTAMDEGLIPDTRPPVHYFSRRTRFRRWRQRKVDGLRMRVGSWVAGVDLADWDDY